MSKRDPVASARRSSVRIDGRVRPLSKRATTGCVVPILRASSCCVRPARFRTSITAEAITNSSSSASYAFRYFGSFIHFLCMSDMRAIATPPSLNRFRTKQGQLYPSRGVFSVFFTNTLTVTTRRPTTVTYSAREIPLRPFSRISHKRPSMCLTCGSLIFQTHFLDEPRDTREPRSHVFGQGLDLCINSFIEGLDSPTHILIHQERYNLGSGRTGAYFDKGFIGLQKKCPSPWWKRRASARRNRPATNGFSHGTRGIGTRAKAHC